MSVPIFCPTCGGEAVMVGIGKYGCLDLRECLWTGENPAFRDPRRTARTAEPGA